MTGLNLKRLFYLIPLLALATGGLQGCTKSADLTAVPEAQQQEAAAQETAGLPEGADAGKTAESAEMDDAAERAGTAEGGLQPVYFDFDRAFIRDDARDIMQANAEWLKANPQTSVRIEGNCDERGTREYNQVLGQRRAQSAKRYLTDLGIAAGRIHLISYGKEKQVCADSTEECWQKNRRSDFVPVEQ